MSNTKKNSVIATMLGLFTSLATAMAVIDFETFDIRNINDCMKLFVICMPAIGGYFSEIKSNK